MSTGMNLGHASFTASVNTQPFVQGMTQMRQLATQTTQQVQQSMTAVTSSSRSTAMGMLYLGQAVDDLQYGFRSIVNNIPQLTMALGGSAGVAGGVAIAAVAINQLMNHWGEMASALSSAWSDSPIGQLEQIRLKAEAAAAALEKVPPYTQGEGKQAASVAEFVQNALKEKLIQDVMGALQRNPATKEGMTGGEQRRTRASTREGRVHGERRAIEGRTDRRYPSGNKRKHA